MDSIIPTKVLSKLSELNELSIDVNLDADQWDVDERDANVKEILNELISLQKLKILRWYLLSVESVQQLRWNNKQVMYPVECNELQTIIDGDSEYRWGVDNKSVFGQKGQIDKGCLSNLRYLALHTCPNLITIFTPILLGNLVKLEELIVEDCLKVRSLVSQESSDFKSSGYVLQNLKKMSLLDLLELVSISGGLSIGPVLESLIVYNCPKLKSLHAMEVSGDNLKIKGEREWWDALKWHALE
ncbi:hypothetical protein LOK49_LG02G02736 [Camellia lanceoleosa]|uniref:Uncharacterized protein n=1 Tax=Camellia lanceoleosa TaxID=1840588 RepID=A0ACC0ILC0_9ERIC|nr:hypothetical protein LOK49_LG02G02736 [Camellia lanceoleosa]